MPIYRTNEIYLREAIESVIQQTFTNYEFLIINDSPDDELRLHKIIASYNNPRIVWIPCSSNNGIAVASNMGIDRSIGEFIAMLDHDDICMPSRFEQQINFLQDNPQFGFVGGQAMGFYPDQSSVALSYPISHSKTALQSSFFDKVPFLNPSIMFRSTTLGEFRYNPDYKVCTDYDLFARLVFAHNIMATNLTDTLLRYRFHDANTSLNQYLLSEEETDKIQAWILQQVTVCES